MDAAVIAPALGAGAVGAIVGDGVRWGVTRLAAAPAGSSAPAVSPASGLRLRDHAAAVAGQIILSLTAWWWLGVRGGGQDVAASGAMLAVILAFAHFACMGVTLARIDIATHRLPDAIVLPCYPVGIALLTIACLLGADPGALGRALAGMAVLFVGYLVLRLVRPGAMGGGDVKLAWVVGLHLAWVGWAPLLVGLLAAFVLGGLFGIVLMIGGRAGRRTAIPFGPWMIAGAWVGLLLGGAATHLG